MRQIKYITAIAALTLFMLTSAGLCAAQEGNKTGLAGARLNHKTSLIKSIQSAEAPPVPPAEIFNLVEYNSPAGKLPAYVSPDPKDTKKHPAIIWIAGGFDQSLSDFFWQTAPSENDQTAAVYRHNGIILMLPSLRGSHNNQGIVEGFYGEIDDIIAAREYLAGLPYVDPERIYLGGHSTGGTMVLLAAECTDKFRAVFSFGPVDQIDRYGQDNLPFNVDNQAEVELRSPVAWLDDLRTPVFIFEGDQSQNLFLVNIMARKTQNPNLKTFEIKGGDHFNILSRINSLIAHKILGDTDPSSSISFTEKELEAASAGL